MADEMFTWTGPKEVFDGIARDAMRYRADIAAPQVLREPTATAEMCLAGIGAYHRHYWPDLSPTEHTWESPTIMCMAKIWRAMYDAAPAQPDSSERDDAADMPSYWAGWNMAVEQCEKVCERLIGQAGGCASEIRALKRDPK
jgi:hypothetical protein